MQTSICRDIFRAVHEGKWLSIEYNNQNGEQTRYWIAIKDINVQRRTLRVEGLHLELMTVMELTIYLDSITEARIIEGSYCQTNEKLIEDLKLHPYKYQSIFTNVVNLKILNYLEECNKADVVPYQCEYALIRKLDGDRFQNGEYALTEEQFREIVRDFQRGSSSPGSRLRMKDICMNVLSIHTPKGLYVLAYRKLWLDVRGRVLREAEDISICTEYTIGGVKQSVRKFLDADDYALLDDVESHLELIKDRIIRGNRRAYKVDDLPYVIALGRDVLVDLRKEYEAVTRMYQQEETTYPVRAFFGEMVSRPVRKKNYPIALLDHRINMDQLLAIYEGMKYPLAYVQGPPGTGKTSTIINTIVTAFFNERTVLFSSYNNHPIDGVCEELKNITYQNRVIPFPMLRLGNRDEVKKSLRNMKALYEEVKGIPIYDSTLDKNRDEKIARTKRLSELLKNYEEVLSLNEQKEALECLLSSNSQLTFQVDLQGRQKRQIEDRLRGIGEISDREARGLLDRNENEFRKYLYYTSAKMIKRLGEPKNEKLRLILDIRDEEKRAAEFGKYLSDGANLKKLLRIFPLIATTCISAAKLGKPEVYFDMVIMDEASQSNNAVSLVPVIRGKSLMLVGDPQQLNPVIVLDEKINLSLRRKYQVPEEYDYCRNSIYKTYLANDPVSEEILLSHHYRCDPRIIDFNNKKYYNGKLKVETQSKEKEPLLYVDVKGNIGAQKNTAPAEAEKIIEYVRMNRDKKIGIITPFANQKRYLEEQLKSYNITDVTCGTVHAFQGDQKDVILFSLAVTDRTQRPTYQWLKNNKELINVATSRAREKLIVISSSEDLNRLHGNDPDDDIYELVEYVKTKGRSQVTEKTAASRALGVKPYSTETEEAFLTSLNHALENVLYYNMSCVVHKEVGIAHVFRENTNYSDLFYSGRFDFVVYQKEGSEELPILAIELDGKEHMEDAVVKERDRRKQEICRAHNLELIRIDNSYARRYYYIKEILIDYFKKMRE